MAGVIYIPSANAADDLTGAVLDSDAAAGTTSTGLSDGTSYRAHALSDPSTAFTPVTAAARDSFTTASATALAAYVGETGKAWTLQGGGAGQAATVEGGRLRANGSNSGRLLSQGTAVPADQFAAGLLRRGSSSTGSSGAAPAVRISGENGYWLRYNQGSNAFQLYKTVAGSSTQLGANVANSGFGFDAAGDSIDLRLEVQGTTVRALIDDAEILSVTDTALAAGLPGLRIFGGSGDALGVNAEFEDFGGEAL